MLPLLSLMSVMCCPAPRFPIPDEGPAAAMSSVKSVFSRKAVVRMQLLKEVVGGDSYRVNNKYDDDHTPLPVSEIIQRAQVLIGQEVSYDLLGSNCEHFVTLLRYGEGVSEQVCRLHFHFHCLILSQRVTLKHNAMQTHTGDSGMPANGP